MSTRGRGAVHPYSDQYRGTMANTPPTYPLPSCGTAWGKTKERDGDLVPQSSKTPTPGGPTPTVPGELRTPYSSVCVSDLVPAVPTAPPTRGPYAQEATR